MNDKQDWIQITVSAILLAIITIIVLEIIIIFYPFQNSTPEELGNLLYILSFILPYLLIIALFNKVDNLKDTILKGAIIGILSGFFLLLFFIAYFKSQKSLNPERYALAEGGYPMILVFCGIFTLFFIISSITGLILSYFIKNKKKTPQN